MLRHSLYILLLAILATPSHAQSPQQVPQWELGLGAAALSVPDYRGSDERSTYVLPIPYFIYRGPLLKADREGARLDFLRADRVRVDLSVTAGPPAKSDDDGARAGMPDLDPTLEAGAALKVLLARSDDGRQALSLQLPLRAAYATDLTYLEPIGWVASPSLSYQFVAATGWQTGLSAGPLFATESYHDYFYEVAPEHATTTRPAFDARSGYSGTYARLTLAKRFTRFWVGMFVRYDDLRGAVFEGSPLVRQTSSLMWGGGIAWVFAQSDRTVPQMPELFR
jgi:outer membrane scaffolding protein for murein synthesis (MipA/OmpV family)